MSHLVRSRWFGFVMGSVCTLALVIALGSATGAWAGTLAQDTQPPQEPITNPVNPPVQAGPSSDEGTTSPTAPDADVSRSIPIQGRLTDASGAPINGTRSITFTLYTASTGGTVVCQDSDSPTLVNGLFDTHIEYCDAADINGQALFLGIWVAGESTEMTPRQVIRPVPYAFSLVPGAEIGGTGAGSGSLYLKDASGVTMFGLTASNGLLDLGGVGDDGDIYVRNMTDTITFDVDGNTGDVSQALAADGLVKAAARAYCGSNSSYIHYSFNNVAGTIIVANGTVVGRCTINFGFDVTDRFVVVTAFGAGVARYLTYSPGPNDNSLNFYGWDEAGIGSNGELMVLIY